MRPFLLAVMGPTAAGKSDLAERLADATGATLINADAFQVYRRFDVGTGKPDRRERYFLLDAKEPEEEYGVGEFVRLALPLLRNAFDGGRSVVVVGGTGLYIRALFEEYDDLAPAPDPALRARLAAAASADLVARLRAEAPEVAARTDLRNPVRVSRALERLASPPAVAFALPPFRRRKIALDPPDLFDRIARRVPAMFAAGWREEVAEIVASGVPLEAPAFRAIGYREIAVGLAAGSDPAATAESVLSLTLRYARRQRTWLRSEPRLHVEASADEAAARTLAWIGAGEE